MEKRAYFLEVLWAAFNINRVERLVRTSVGALPAMKSICLGCIYGYMCARISRAVAVGVGALQLGAWGRIVRVEGVLILRSSSIGEYFNS